MPDTIREYAVGQFRGDFPDVQIAEGVNLDELRGLDADPVFVTLPVIPEVGAISKNGLLYDEALANSIVTQINDKRPGGIFGHLKDEDRSSAFPIPDGQWVGAERKGKTVWGKAYIPPGAARDHIRRLKAVGGSIATSIYGKGAYEAVRDGVRRLKDFNLESLDFAPPERAALAYSSALHLTSETTKEHIEMGETTQVVEITAKDVPAPVREQIIADWQKESNTANRIGELEKSVTDRDAVIETLQSQLAQVQVKEFESALDAKVAELVNWQAQNDNAAAKVAAFRRIVRETIVSKMGDKERTAETVSEVADVVWADLKPLAETVRDALAGPAAMVTGKRQNPREIEDTPATRAAARARMGL